MSRDNIVIFKGKKDGLVIVLDQDAAFADLAETLSDKIRSAGKFFGGATTNISFQGRELSEGEEARLFQIIKESNLNVLFVSQTAPENESQKTPPNKEPDEHTKPASFQPSMLVSNKYPCMTHRGTLRSGSKIRFDGTVIVVGNTNQGSEIFAEGSIIVFGTVKGMLHAGCYGDAEAVVAALNLTPTQLRIAVHATIIPNTDVKKGKKTMVPSYAYIEDEQICIAPLE